MPTASQADPSIHSAAAKPFQTVLIGIVVRSTG
jgi:hypothetical protein